MRMKPRCPDEPRRSQNGAEWHPKSIQNPALEPIGSPWVPPGRPPETPGHPQRDPRSPKMESGIRFGPQQGAKLRSENNKKHTNNNTNFGDVFEFSFVHKQMPKCQVLGSQRRYRNGSGRISARRKAMASSTGKTHINVTKYKYEVTQNHHFRSLEGVQITTIIRS